MSTETEIFLNDLHAPVLYRGMQCGCVVDFELHISVTYRNLEVGDTQFLKSKVARHRFEPHTPGF